jgi:hypothetical protein
MKSRNMHETDVLDQEIGRRLKNALAQIRPPAQRRSHLMRAATAYASVERQSGGTSSLISMIRRLFAAPAKLQYGKPISSFNNLRASYSTGIRLLGFTF